MQRCTHCQLSSITLAELMGRANLSASSTVIDHLWLDNEGGEYTLLPTLVQRVRPRDSAAVRPRAAQNSTPIVCQMNVELHAPVAHYGLADDDAFDAFVVEVRRPVRHTFSEIKRRAVNATLALARCYLVTYMVTCTAYELQNFGADTKFAIVNIYPCTHLRLFMVNVWDDVCRQTFALQPRTSSDTLFRLYSNWT